MTAISVNVAEGAAKDWLIRFCWANRANRPPASAATSAPVWPKPRNRGEASLLHIGRTVSTSSCTTKGMTS